MPDAKQRVYTLSATSAKSSVQRLAIIASHSVLNFSRSCVTSLPKNSGASSAGSHVTTGTSSLFASGCLLPLGYKQPP